MRLPATGATLLAALAAGCREPSPATQSPAPAHESPQVLPQRSDASCAAPPDAPTARERLRAATGTLRLGVLAGLKDAQETNVAHLQALQVELVRRGAEVLVVDGDLGDNADEQRTLLGALAASGLPLIAVAGNREARAELDAAEADLRKRGTRLVDLSHVRVVDLGDVVVVGLPGTFERRHLRTAGACLYVQRDLDALAALLQKLAAGPPALLVAAVPPRGMDARALDASEGQNVGDPRLQPLLKAAPFGIFGQVWEAGGRAIDGAGHPVAPSVDSGQLYLNPGAADKTPWPLSGGGASRGRAALLTVHGRSARWEPVVLQEI